MEEFINQMCAKVGIDHATADKVIEFLKEHADELPKLLANAGPLGGLMGQAQGFLGGLGGKKNE
jgi:hypothetical protein